MSSVHLADAPPVHGDRADLPAAGADGMVERAARALCVAEGGAEEEWPVYAPMARIVIAATMLPAIPVAPGDRPEAHPELTRWAQYRKHFGEAGARAREPDLNKLDGWHVLAAWRTWNGMAAAALSGPTP